MATDDEAEEQASDALQAPNARAPLALAAEKAAHLGLQLGDLRPQHVDGLQHGDGSLRPRAPAEGADLEALSGNLIGCPGRTGWTGRTLAL